MADAIIHPGGNHIYQYEGVESACWRLRAGWELVEILGVQYGAEPDQLAPEGAYVMLVHVRSLENVTEPLLWPPFETGAPE